LVASLEPFGNGSCPLYQSKGDFDGFEKRKSFIFSIAKEKKKNKSLFKLAFVVYRRNFPM